MHPIQTPLPENFPFKFFNRIVYLSRKSLSLRDS
jgi:hypothetical protein